ncbi:DUF4112 domain-containing protein [Halobacteriales archaeon QH_7_69_31]|nr:MAG: DUF4112 domain-containing protein [Halobacteriales archaeon QH_7_69_31]
MATQSASSLESQFDDIDEVPDSVDEAAVRRMRFVANLLDDSIRVPGTDLRIGIDPILGILPGAGDAMAAAMSVYIVLESARLGVPFLTLLRMMANVTLDFAIGSVPVIGPLFDAAWKANQKNVELAVEHLGGESPEFVVE